MQEKETYKLEWYIMTTAVGLVITILAWFSMNTINRVQALEDKGAQVLVDRNDIETIKKELTNIENSINVLSVNNHAVWEQLKLKN